MIEEPPGIVSDIATVIGLILATIPLLVFLGYSLIAAYWLPGTEVVNRLQNHDVPTPWIPGMSGFYLLSEKWVEKNVLQDPSVPQDVKDEVKRFRDGWSRYLRNLLLLLLVFWVLGAVGMIILTTLGRW